MTNYNLNLNIEHKDYYYRITRNSKNHLVQQKCKKSLDKKSDVLMLDNRLSYNTIDNEIVDNLEYAEDHYYREYLMSIVQRYTPKLDERLQKIISLRYVFNKSTKEISKILNLSSARTNQLYNKSIRLLQKMCKKELYKNL
jgi:RNA polymerase sigma factor (sigma-70 family)